MPKSAGNKMLNRFSADEDELLIDFVHKHPILYDLKDEDFKNTRRKDLIWKEVGKLFNRGGEECKKRWKSVRDHYRREKKQEIGSTGSAAKKKRAAYWERLSFLEVVDDERDTISNTPTEPVNQLSPSSAAEIESADWAAQEGSSSENTSQQLYQHSSLPQTSKCSENQESGVADFRSLQSKRRRERVLDRYLTEKQKDMDHFKRCLEQLVTAASEENETDLFFKTAAATVKKFRPDLATQAKGKIFQIITEMELMNQQTQLSNAP